MLSQMLRFVEVAKQMPDKRDITLRRTDFQEIYQRFDPKRAALQAARYSQAPSGNRIVPLDDIAL